MQRTRWAYRRDEVDLPCNKRRPGSGCSALHGLNRNHAIFGWSDACVATHPSDVAVALAALDANVIVRRRTGERSIPFTEFHRLPGNTPERDTVLERGDLIVALVSAAVALATDGRRIRSARLALGGVAHQPWRLRAAETALRGVSLDDADGLLERDRCVLRRGSPARPQCL